MARTKARQMGLEPLLGGQGGVQLTGMEPSLGRDFAPVYGDFRVRGLEAPGIVGRRRPLALVAYPDPDAAALIQLIGGSNGYEVKTTNNGLDSLGLLAQFKPDIFVLNSQLGPAGGLDVIRRLRSDADDSLRQLPVLIMDANNHPQGIMAAFEAGADDYLEMLYDVSIMLRCWKRVTAEVRRPAPLTALQNDDAKVRQVALSYLLKVRPPGLIDGLADLLWSADPELNPQIQWALRQLGTDEALAVLTRCRTE